MAGLIKFSSSYIINNERSSVLCAEPGYGLVRIPVKERRFSLFHNVQTVSAIHSFNYSDWREVDEVTWARG
jgi:hypothetical protein